MSGTSWHEVSFPADFSPEQSEAYFRSLSSGRQFRMLGTPAPIIFEVVSDGGRLTWRVGLPEHRAAGILAGLRAIAPGLSAVPVNHPGYEVTYGWELRMGHQFVPLRTDTAEQTSTSVLHGLGLVRSGEQLVLQWVVGGSLTRHRPKVPAGSSSAPDPLALLADIVVDRDDVAALKVKQQEPVFAAVGRIAVKASTTARSRQLASGVFGSLELSRSPGSGLQRRLMPGGMVARRMRRVLIPWGAWPCPLNASELTSLIGWPYQGPVLCGVSYRSQRQLPAAQTVLVRKREHAKGRVFAAATFPGREGFLVQRPADSLLHTWALGPSGQGKSTLLGNLVLQDIAAGRGAVLIEPRGDLVRDVLARLDPKRLADVVVLDAGDPVAPVGINPLGVGGRNKEIAADTFLAVLRGLYGDNLGVRSTDIVHAGVLTLAHDPEASLVNLPLLLSDRNYQQKLVPLASAADPWGLRPFWAWFSQLSDEQRATVLAPLGNKLRPILLRSNLRRVLGQAHPHFNLRQVFTERKILLVSLASGTIGSEAAALLGSLLVGMLWQTIQGRSEIPPERRHPVGLVIDEFQNYLHLSTDLSDVLAQARGLGVGVVAAHQHLGQLTPKVKAALLANAQSRVLFRLPADDAAVMAKTSRLLSTEDIEGLGRYETYVSLVSQGAVTPYASARTLPLPEPVRDPNVVVERSRARWGIPVKEIDAQHRAILEPRSDGGGPIGPRRRGGGAS